MPKYRLKEKMKHRMGSVLYKAGDIIELTEENAKKILSKLELLGVPTPEEFAGEPSPLPAEGTEEGKEGESEKEAEESSSPPDSPPGEPTPSEDSSSEPVGDSSPLSLGHAGQGKWNVLKDGKSINDVPLSEEAARAMLEGAQ